MKQKYTMKLENGQTAFILYDQDVGVPNSCAGEFAGALEITGWPEIIDCLSQIQDQRTSKTGKALELRWTLESGRKISFSISLHRNTEPNSPESIRAQLASKFTPERLAEIVATLPPESQEEIVKTYLVDPPTKRSQHITIEKP